MTISPRYEEWLRPTPTDCVRTHAKRAHATLAAGPIFILVQERLWQLLSHSGYTPSPRSQKDVLRNRDAIDALSGSYTLAGLRITLLDIEEATETCKAEELQVLFRYFRQGQSWHMHGRVDLDWNAKDLAYPLGQEDRMKGGLSASEVKFAYAVAHLPVAMVTREKIARLRFSSSEEVDGRIVRAPAWFCTALWDVLRWRTLRPKWNAEVAEQVIALCVDMFADLGERIQGGKPAPDTFDATARKREASSIKDLERRARAEPPSQLTA